MVLASSNVLGLIIVVLLIGGVIVWIEASKTTPTTPIPEPVQPTLVDKTGFERAPELQGITGYINAQPDFRIADLRGKIVLVDFWTYTCINCIRTQPYLNEWHEKYADQGLVIVGVHTPEFAFEKELENVQQAVVDAQIKYPVVLDNDYVTWNAYNNHWWPHKYLVDADGFIRYDHIGEGAYDETEQQIVALLAEKNQAEQPSSPVGSVQAETPDFAQIKTPELYLGYSFARAPLGNEEGFQPEQTVSYSIPSELKANLVYLQGEWENKSDFVRLVSDSGKIKLVFTAKKLNIVAGASSPVDISVLLDNQPIAPENKGTDIQFQNQIASVTIQDEKLYNLVSTPGYGTHTIEIQVNSKDLELYSFTFG